MGYLVFINYRRQKDHDAVRSIAEALKSSFGVNQVFFDTDSLKTGEDWPPALEAALRKSAVVLAILGKNWLTAKDQHQRRRIDNEDDWVRREIIFALNSEAVLIPVLLDNAILPTANDLPQELVELSNRQKFRIRRESWGPDISALIQGIREAIQREGETKIFWPKGFSVRPTPLGQEQIQKALEELPTWHVERVEIADDDRVQPGYQGTELVRYFKFKTFLDAIEFMRITSKTIDEWDHHPKWDNIYWNIKVRVTTWDILHQLSDRDVKLANFLERAFNEFPGRD